jgi:hypothetical protein
MDDKQLAQEMLQYMNTQGDVSNFIQHMSEQGYQPEDVKIWLDELED